MSTAQPGTKSNEPTKATGDEAQKSKQISPQEILDGFKKMREEQSQTVQKIAEMKSDQNEYRLVIETLEQVEPDRRCHRLVGGVLVERTAGDVLPQLKDNMHKMGEIIKMLEEKLKRLSKDITEYREKHNIRFLSEDQLQQQQKAKAAKNSSENTPSKQPSNPTGLLAE